MSQILKQHQEKIVLKEAFNSLRPHCVAMTKQANSTNARTLLDTLQKLDGHTLQNLQQYILFPFRVVLHNTQNKNEELVEVSLQCLLEIFNKTSLDNWQLFSDYFQLMCSLLSANVQANPVCFAEEIQLVTVKCLQQLIQNADSKILSNLYCLEYLPSVGHAVSVLLNVAEHQKLHTLRLQALSCLDCLCQDSSDVGAALTHQIGDVFASFLPGVSSTLVKMIINEPKVSKYALHTWGCMLEKVLDDSAVSKVSKSPEHSHESIHKFMVVRNESWVLQTGSKLHILLTKARIVARYDNWKVRLEVVDFVSKLLQSCKRSLTESIPILIEMLVGLTTDPYSQVANASQATLTSVKQTFHENNCRDITEILEDNMFALTTSLPRTVMVADDAEKLARINLLLSYVELLGEKLCQVLYSSSHLKRLSLCLMTILEFDTNDIKITQQKNMYHDIPVNFSSKDEMIWNPERRFKRVNDKKIEETLKTICRSLAKYGDLNVLVEHFVDLFLESSVYRKQAVWVLNELMAGCQYPNPISHTCITRLINEYLSSSSWRAHNHQNNQTNDSVSSPPQLTIKNNMVVLSCLLLDGLAAAAKVMNDAFEVFLINTLYPVLVKVADSNMLISQSAYKTVRAFSQACKYSCIEELIFRNVDYLLDCLSVELRLSHFNTNALLVLQAMLQYGGDNLLPLIHQAINQVLSLIGEHQQGDIRHLLLVCQALVKAIRKWFNINIDETKTTEPSGESVCEFIVKHHRLQQENILNNAADRMAETNIKENEETAEKPVEAIEDTEDEKETMHVTIVVQLLENCVHLLGIEDSKQQTLILDIVIEAIVCLSPHQEKMLPLAHQLWPTVVQRLSHSNYNVRIKAVECISSLSKCCHDFLKKRILKDVLPNLTHYLKKQSQYSVKKDSIYHHKLEYKLQLIILNNIGQICIKVGLGGLDVLRLAVACLTYLENDQPPALQTSTQALMEQLKTIEYDAIDLMLEDYVGVS